ncbi:hypothetical protein EVG20_g11645, partial [Dentipellis fragilis]
MDGLGMLAKVVETRKLLAAVTCKRALAVAIASALEGLCGCGSVAFVDASRLGIVVEGLGPWLGGRSKVAIWSSGGNQRPSEGEEERDEAIRKKVPDVRQSSPPIKARPSRRTFNPSHSAGPGTARHASRSLLLASLLSSPVLFVSEPALCVSHPFFSSPRLDPAARPLPLPFQSLRQNAGSRTRYLSFLVPIVPTLLYRHLPSSRYQNPDSSILPSHALFPFLFCCFSVPRPPRGASPRDRLSLARALVGTHAITLCAPPALPPFLLSASDPRFASTHTSLGGCAPQIHRPPPPVLELVSRRDPASDPAILSSLGHTVPHSSLAVSPRSPTRGDARPAAPPLRHKACLRRACARNNLSLLPADTTSPASECYRPPSPPGAAPIPAPTSR